jgi:hypothetical protein
MRKIVFIKEEIDNIIKLYNVDLLSSRSISSKYNVDSGVISKLLKENNIKLRNSGRINLGGKSESDKRYYRKNKEKRLLYISRWHKKNRTHLNEYHKEWREKNIEHHRSAKNEYQKARKAKDPTYKLICNFRTAIYTVLKENNIYKYGHYFEVLGYRPEDLVKHLTSQLKDGMTWENYGKWHIDHKLPISSFMFKDMNDPEFKRCWSLENLQPLWESENLSKSTHIL